MGSDPFLIAVILLAGFAIFDLVVGVSNDAVNFLNSSIGSRVAPRHFIMIIASLGILAGVVFSSGMMEVARKGIFHPQFFNMPELLTIFLAVMLTDIMLLDLFNTYGLPTSTTVSIVFELLGGAVAVSFLKIMHENNSLVALADYINTSKAMIIIFGILLSVVVAFICGSVVQFFSRLLFTFDYVKRLRRYGAIWGGIGLASITYFILVKGAKGASFISPETVQWITQNTWTILLSIAAISAVLLQLLLLLRVNILKPIVLVGTFALAMAFAANDLVNFIGVPIAGFQTFKIAITADNPLTSTMGALGQQIHTSSFLLLFAGMVMVITLWISKKARSVTETEIRLGEQTEGVEKFESAFLSRAIVRLFLGLFGAARLILPAPLRGWMKKRLDTSHYKADTDSEHRPSFDLLRASVNLMVASAVISYATSQKLPLSTTYVTFMVAMGSSFADLAWGRDSAVYRITGVLTVVGGWFVTAFLAFTFSALIAVTLFYAKAYGVVGLILLAGLIIWKNHHKHKERATHSEMEQVFNLRRVTDVSETISITFEQMALLLREIRLSLGRTLNALFDQNDYVLRSERKKVKMVQRWSNIIVANVFKALRLLQKEDAHISYKYGQTIRRLQKLSDGHRDILMRSHVHVSNHHRGLLPEQIEELKKVDDLLQHILLSVEEALSKRAVKSYQSVIEKDRQLRELAEELNQRQIERIRTGKSKTRLSILFYAIVGNAMMLSKQNLKLLEIFSTAFVAEEYIDKFDMD